MVQPGGPRLARRPTHDDILLLLFDVRTATQLGYVRSYVDDLKVYQQLMEAGAKVVYDTRSCAAATQADFAELQPLLDGMLKLTGTSGSSAADLNPVPGTAPTSDNGPNGLAAKPQVTQKAIPRVLREIYLSSSVIEGGIEQYAPLAASNPLNAFPHAIPAARVRLYPLAYIDSFGTCESAPLAVARRYWELPRIETQPLVETLYNSGVLTEWHRQYPADTNPSDEPPSPYPIGPNTLAWHTFLSNSILILPAGFWVNYESNCLDFPRYSYLDVLQKNAEQIQNMHLAGKIVIVGYSLGVDPGNEIYEVPSGAGKACAAEVVALATQTVLEGRSMRPVPAWIELLVLSAFCLVVAGLATWLKPLEAVTSALFILLLYLISIIIAYRLGYIADFAITPLAGLLTATGCGTISAWRSHRNHGRVVDMFGRYVPRAVVNQLMLQPELDALQLGGSQREVSVLFADVRGFTSFAEKLPPDRVVQELNSLLREMVECTFENEGTLDKFIGDAILVLFNAPLDQPDHVTRAVQTALQMQQRLNEHSGSLRVGIGLHVGPAVVGNIGTPKRMEYTAIGNTVNIAARLCDFAEGGSVIVSQAVAERLNADFSLQPHSPIQVKGLSEPIAVWSVGSISKAGDS